MQRSSRRFVELAAPRGTKQRTRPAVGWGTSGRATGLRASSHNRARAPARAQFLRKDAALGMRTGTLTSTQPDRRARPGRLRYPSLQACDGGEQTHSIAVSKTFAARMPPRNAAGPGAGTL